MSTSQHPFRQSLAGGLFLSGIALLFPGAAWLPAQTDVTGFWILRVPNGGITYFDLKQAGESITGSYVNGGPVRPLSGSPGWMILHSPRNRHFAACPPNSAPPSARVPNTFVPLTRHRPGKARPPP